MCLTPKQLDLLRAASEGAVSPIDEPEAGDLRILARAGLVLEDEGGRSRQTEAGRRYVDADDAKGRAA